MKKGDILSGQIVESNFPDSAYADCEGEKVLKCGGEVPA